jgi:hypothetical protein
LRLTFHLRQAVTAGGGKCFILIAGPFSLSDSLVDRRFAGAYSRNGLFAISTSSDKAH